MSLASIDIIDLAGITSQVQEITDAATAAVDAAVATYGIAAPITADQIQQAIALGELASSVGEVVTDLACGEEGIFTEIKRIQIFAQQKVALGKNIYFEVLDTINQVQTIIEQIQDPDLLISLLQQEALNIVSQAILNNPTSANALATIAELRAAYQSAGPAAERIIDNIQQFINDPLNTSLDVCNDIPNLIKIGETFVLFPAKAIQADPSATLESIQETIVNEYEDIFNNPATRAEEILNEFSEQPIRTTSKYPTPDVLNDIIVAGRVPISQAYLLGPGSAHKAAVSAATTSPIETQFENKSNPSSIPSLANPFPEGTQYVGADFSLSKNSKNIATKINTLHPICRKNFANAIKNFLEKNPGFDINISEAYRAPYGSANIKGGLTPPQVEVVSELNKNGITDSDAVANILAQIQAESGFRPRSENLAGYSAQTLFRLFGVGNEGGNTVRFNSIQEAQELRAQGPEAVGNLLYGGRLGNSPTEGFKYRGRGLIQLTGKANYREYSKKVGVDLVANPDLANDPSIASRIAVQYFLTKQSSGTDLTNIESVGRAVGYAGGTSETNKRATIADDFKEKLAIGGYDNLPPGDSWHNYGVAADIIVYGNGNIIDPERNPQIYENELKTSFSSQGLVNDKAAERSHFYLASLGGEVPDELKNGEVAFNEFINYSPSEPSVATAFASADVVTNEGNVTRIDISQLQRDARDKAISDALAEGKSEAEAERLGAIAGNNAGTEALRNLS